MCDDMGWANNLTHNAIPQFGALLTNYPDPGPDGARWLWLFQVHNQDHREFPFWNWKITPTKHKNAW